MADKKSDKKSKGEPKAKKPKRAIPIIEQRKRFKPKG